MLLGVPKDAPQASPNPNAAQIKAATNSALNSTNMVQTQTGMDGNYMAANVAPGDYYVFAWVRGYMQPSAMLQAAMDAGADMTKPIPGIPVTHVSVGEGARQDLTVERGGAISGHVMWDDGSPASQAVVMVVSTKANGKKLPRQFAMLTFEDGTMQSSSVMSTSDDLGQFRISGLPPGEYVVVAMLEMKRQVAIQSGVMDLRGAGPDRPLMAYAPAAFHKADAKPVTLRAGDEVTGEDVTINLTGTHSVSGKVSSKADDHGINSATVELTDASDKDMVLSAGVDASGNFTVGFVPPGTYNLTVTGAADTQPSEYRSAGLYRFANPDTVRSYEDGKQSVIVTDSDVVGANIALTPSKNKPSVNGR